MSNKKSTLPICCIEHGHEDVLLKPAQEITFPLSSKIKTFIKDFIVKFKETENCAGLAAPQVGKPYKIIILHVEEDYKNYRDDVYDLLPMTVYINPSYEPIGDEMVVDWEACFSVESQAGKVPRHKKIKFKAYDVKGHVIEKEVEGFLARLLQHETDHVNGRLITSRFRDDLPHGTFEEIRTMRMKEIEEKKKNK